jgi:hypothetical protein
VTRSWELEEASKPCANELVGNYGLLIAIVEVRRKKEGEESWWGNLTDNFVKKGIRWDLTMKALRIYIQQIGICCTKNFRGSK